MAPEGWTNFADKQPKLANLALKPKSTSNDGAELIERREKINDMQSMLAAMGALAAEEDG